MACKRRSHHNNLFCNVSWSIIELESILNIIMEFCLPVIGFHEGPEIIQARFKNYVPMSCRFKNQHMISPNPFNVFIPWWANAEDRPSQEPRKGKEAKADEKQWITESEDNKKWEKVLLLKGFNSEDIKVKILSKNRILVEGVKNNSLFIMRYVYVPENVDINTLKVTYSEGKLILSAARKAADVKSKSEEISGKEQEEIPKDTEKTNDDHVVVNAARDEEKYVEAKNENYQVKGSTSQERKSTDTNIESHPVDNENISDENEPEIKEEIVKEQDERDIECEQINSGKDVSQLKEAGIGDSFNKTFNLGQFSAESVKVKVNGDKVIVQAHHVEEEEGCEGFTEYYREVALPDDVDADRLTSQMDAAGLLTVTAPRKLRQRDIPVNIQ